MNNQAKNFHKDGPGASKYVMTNPIVHAAWATLVGRRHVLATDEDRWYATAREVRGFVKRTGKRPSRYSKNADERRIGQWVEDQIKRHKPEGASSSTKGHRKLEVHAHWAALVHDYPVLGRVKKS